MEKTFQPPENGQYYLGKVRDVTHSLVRVSVFTPDEYIFDVGIGHFPAKPQTDDVFKYFQNGMVEVIQLQTLSPLEIQTLSAEVEAQVPRDEF